MNLFFVQYFSGIGHDEMIAKAVLEREGTM